MEEFEKNKILNFLVGDEASMDFEYWLYNESDLESRVGEDLYFELIEVNYDDKDILNILQKKILDKYISQADFERSRYYKILRDSGWYPNRKISLHKSKINTQPEVQNAEKILEEFGGLKLVSPCKTDNWTLTLVEFLDHPNRTYNMSDYGINKNFVCFASAHNDHINLFVDGEGKFYQLDNVVSLDLYLYEGDDFEQMMKELLELTDTTSFKVIGKKKR
ncbi:SUKH-3 domain-containing protein [Sediminitomix flava]|uniref:SUKH-3 immunity protein of toxin-antitoxin system n=1 Tax=Sediminitomix flava TaxID=379075 RepID=A0A315Z5G8_SEDFL|nr:SUKH-3 domain-containing protein [Sediminitomix flava]PWJ38662.1 SUKH-3 immunity protein of toxin-antitoxin system [Sediminitomix flava]